MSFVQKMSAMQRFSIGFVFYSLLILACQDPKVETVELVDDLGYTERYIRKKLDYAKDGLYEKISPEGKVVERTYYTNDTLNGPRLLFSINGDTSVVEYYKMGAFEGAYRSYYEDGNLELEGQYQNNEMTGSWNRFYPSGQLMETVSFEKNQENGPFLEYYENGNLKAEGVYLEGDREQDTLKLYHETGPLMRVMNCNRGVCRTIWRDTLYDKPVDLD